MNIKKGLYAISDCSINNEQLLIEKTEIILSAGVSLFQYRNKEKNEEIIIRQALKLQTLCKKYKTPFIVNDNLSLAIEISADGIHLGKDDIDIHTARQSMNCKMIGVSCYNDIERALIAEQAGASYVAFGAFFPSVSKPDAVTADTAILIEAKKKLTIPIVAIGGITPENGKTLVDMNADLLAVISCLYDNNNTKETVNRFNKLFN